MLSFYDWLVYWSITVTGSFILIVMRTNMAVIMSPMEHSRTQSPWGRVVCENLIVINSQEILRLLWNPKVQYHDHKIPPLKPIVNHISSVYTFINYLLDIHLKIIPPSTPSYSKWSVPFMFSDKNFVCISQRPHACCIPHPSHLPCSYLNTCRCWNTSNLIWGMCLITENFMFSCW
jgi:hypothetical protein